jgi:hypothetical protein
MAAEIARRERGRTLTAAAGALDPPRRGHDGLARSQPGLALVALAVVDVPDEIFLFPDVPASAALERQAPELLFQ